MGPVGHVDEKEWTLAVVPQGLEQWSKHSRVKGLILGQGIVPGLQFYPWAHWGRVLDGNQSMCLSY